MAGVFLSDNMARQLIFFLILFYVERCLTGVVPLSFKQNDILGIADDQSEEVTPVPNSTLKKQENSTSRKAEKLNSAKLSLNSNVSLSHLNGTKNSSEPDSGSLSIATLPSEIFDIPGNGSTIFDRGNQPSVDFDPDNDDEHERKFDKDKDSVLTPVLNGTSALTQFELPNSPVRNVTSHLNSEVSNQTGRHETETGIESGVQFKESDSNISTLLYRNNTESIFDANFLNESDGNNTINGSLDLDVETGNNKSEVSGELESQIDMNETGLLSNLGFDFFRNSEVAKNAAMAMQVFNFSDSLTDHIIEENEFHTFLDVSTHAPEGSENLNSKEAVFQEQFSDKNINDSENVKELKLLENETSTSSVTELEETEKEKSDFILTDLQNLNDSLELTNLTKHISNINETLIPNTSTIANETDFAEFENVTELEFANLTEFMEVENQTSVSIESNITEVTEVSLAEIDLNSTTNVSPQCPPPGLCVFWFLSQDECAVNSHCLGSRICCRIRCSRTCIEV